VGNLEVATGDGVDEENDEKKDSKNDFLVGATKDDGSEDEERKPNRCAVVKIRTNDHPMVVKTLYAAR
jgi:hypothetical protein